MTRTRILLKSVFTWPLRMEELEVRNSPGDVLRSLLGMPFMAPPAFGDIADAPAPTQPILKVSFSATTISVTGTGVVAMEPVQVYRTTPAKTDDAASTAAPPVTANASPIPNFVNWFNTPSAPSAPAKVAAPDPVVVVQASYTAPPTKTDVPVASAPFSGVQVSVEPTVAADEPMAHPMDEIDPFGGSGPGGGYTAAQIRHAYGIDNLTLTGAGQTIAIVDAYNEPNIKADANAFSTKFGLPLFNTGTGPTLSVVGQTGGTRLPSNNSGWGLEIALDVEWAHAIAPKANILLVEASSASYANLFTAVSYASSVTHVVSMSWGGGEFSGETSYDSYFRKSGVVFTAASGDSGTGVIYPAASPYVLAVGGTTLNLDANNVRSSETAWSGSGGGVSGVETRPGYQSAFNGNSRRGVPDVSWDANPSTGFSVYDSYAHGGWVVVGGTSAGAPQWAGLVALANQGRAAAGGGYLSMNSLTTSPFYGAANNAANYASNFYDVTSGTNGTGANTSAGTGYDFVTGLGSPQGDHIVNYLTTH